MTDKAQLSSGPMNISASFHKTAKGEQEIIHRSHGLAPKARLLLIMVNGKLTGDVLKKRGIALGGADLFNLLVAGGYIAPVDQTAQATNSERVSSA